VFFFSILSLDATYQSIYVFMYLFIFHDCYLFLIYVFASCMSARQLLTFINFAPLASTIMRKIDAVG